MASSVYAYVYRGVNGPLIAQISFHRDSVAPDHACVGHPVGAHPMVARDVLYYHHARGYSDVLDGSATVKDFDKLCRRYERRGYYVMVRKD